MAKTPVKVRNLRKKSYFIWLDIIGSFVEKIRTCCNALQLKHIVNRIPIISAIHRAGGHYSDWNRYHAFCVKKRINTLPASVTAIRRFRERKPMTENTHRQNAGHPQRLACQNTVCFRFANPIKRRRSFLTPTPLTSSNVGDAKQTNAIDAWHTWLNWTRCFRMHVKPGIYIHTAIYNVMFWVCFKAFGEPSRYRTSDVGSIDSDYQITTKDYLQVTSHKSWASQFRVGFHLRNSLTDFCSCVSREIDKTRQNIGLQTLDDSFHSSNLRRASDLLQLAENYHFSGNSDSCWRSTRAVETRS